MNEFSVKRSDGTIYHQRRQQPWPKDKPFRILSIDGGGIRGILPARILERVESQVLGGGRICDHVEMICGTSTGGIIASALGLGIPAQQILSLYKDEGQEIFPKAKGDIIGLATHITKPLHERKPLDDKLEREFEGYVFGQSVARLVIPSFDENIEPNVWKTDHHEDYKRDWKLPAGAPVAATSAAPVFLAAYTGMERIQWDGGLYANNPLMMGVVDALACYNLKREQIEVISIGCGKVNLSPPKADAGIGQWVTKLQKVTGALQLHDSLGQAGLLIGRQRILRIDPVLLQDIPLDDYKASAEHLPDLADRAFGENVEAIEKFFRLPALARERHYSTKLNNLSG